MGLDNGVSIRRNGNALAIYDKLAYLEQPWDIERRYDFEVAYFRKCYNIRNLIFNHLDYADDNGITPLDVNDIGVIIEVLKSLNTLNWDDEGGSIWTYEEQEPFIQQAIKNLTYLQELMADYDLDVYFYDSY